MLETNSEGTVVSFQRGELAKIKAAELGAIIVLDVSGQIAIGTTTNPMAFARHYRSAKAPCRIAYVGWALDPLIARRIRSTVEDILSGRKVDGGAVIDAPLPLAIAAIDIAARRLGTTLRTTDAVLAEIREQEERRAQKLVEAVSRKPAID